MKLKEQEQAFTLIEILIVIAIVGIVMSLLLGVMISAKRVSNFNKNQLNLQQEGRIFLMMLSKDVRRSLNISSSTPESLKLEIDVDGDGTKDRDVEYVYDTTKQTVVLNKNKNVLKGIAKNLKFNHIKSSGLVEIELELSKDNKSYHIYDQFYMRIKN